MSWCRTCGDTGPTVMHRCHRSACTGASAHVSTCYMLWQLVSLLSGRRCWAADTCSITEGKSRVRGGGCVERGFQGQVRVMVRARVGAEAGKITVRVTTELGSRRTARCGTVRRGGTGGVGGAAGDLMHLP